MEDHKRQLNVYKLRPAKENDVTDKEIQQRMRWDMPVLSKNSKCSISLDLPVENCVPTGACAAVCYASQGRHYYRKALIKSLAINRLIAEDPERVARKMVDEAAGRSIRLCGSGDILPEHKTLVDYVESFGGTWWGFTRRVDSHRVLPDLMFSIDATTTSSVMQYVQDQVPVRRRAYLRRPTDPPPPLEVAVTFPTHGPWTNYADQTPRHETDCPAVRDEVKCWQCQRCY